MPPKPGGSAVWDNPSFLMEMSIAFYTVAQNSGALNAKAKDAIIEYMESQGHTTTWEAVR
ncbi:Fc.00g014930.m01.CDS01 [Cosmosporella sp. VM-42]